MTSTFSYQYYFIHYSFEENSDKNDPCGLQRKYVTNSSRDLWDHYILHEFDDGQPITELDSEYVFLIGRPVINLQTVEEMWS